MCSRLDYTQARHNLRKCQRSVNNVVAQGYREYPEEGVLDVRRRRMRLRTSCKYISEKR